MSLTGLQETLTPRGTTARPHSPPGHPGPPVPVWPHGPYSLVLPRLLTQGLPPLLSLHADLLALQLLHRSLVLLWTREASAQHSQPGCTLMDKPCPRPGASGGAHIWAEVLPPDSPPTRARL